ncbi:hypothetical protein JHD48_06320 [Sulfurimonas sp. SAG-AH-194-I05]|nr:hypothetical protein [Sulfurimonas sp. SAG-AH-194-I05]MDF1875343.1 hypothetical protein [Sulfurimonas sp. SAG-AH-194-I05]
MIKIHLLVEEDYIEELMRTLPSDKVRVVEENFDANTIELKKVFEAYKKNDASFSPFDVSRENINNWLKEQK